MKIHSKDVFLKIYSNRLLFSFPLDYIRLLRYEQQKKLATNGEASPESVKGRQRRRRRPRRRSADGNQPPIVVVFVVASVLFVVGYVFFVDTI